MRDFTGNERFLVRRRLGAGGMGVVYEALDRKHAQTVAIKTLQRLDGKDLLRFKTEFHALQDLAHRNLVRMGNLFEDSGAWFFTMELVLGRDFVCHVRGESALTQATASEDSLPTDDEGFLPFVPVGGVCDEARLRAALGQLIEGVAALHEAGKLHCDLKPSNVLVRNDGRVVVLDFGLAAEAEPWARASSGSREPLAAPGAASGPESGAGTLLYMAPEQAAAEPVSYAADWYAVGVMLYEAITGMVPFADARGVSDFKAKKLAAVATAPSALGVRAAADLEALCMDLLAREPGARPTASAILRRLGENGRRRARLPEPRFVGRQAELGEIASQYAAPRPRVVIVRAESGLGKSALVRRFVSEVRGAARVLFGRCYQRESVPFKAFDGIVDALCRSADAAALLARLSAAQRRLLAQTFPALLDVITDADAEPTLPASQQERRAQLFSAMRAWLSRLCEERPILFVIDDLQWADGDSLAMLAEVLREPDAPPLFVLATMRKETELLSALATLLGHKAHVVELGPLPVADAETLARERLRAAGRELDVAALLRETAGHPLFLEEMIRYATGSGGLAAGSSTGGGSSGQLLLADVIRARVAELDAVPRQLLALVSLARGPLAPRVLADAAGIDTLATSNETHALEVLHLLRSEGALGDGALETAHDRVREAVCDGLASDALRAHHEELARALAAHTPDAHEARSHHLAGAGDFALAAGQAVAAAAHAEQALAFDRAAHMYLNALELNALAANSAGTDAAGPDADASLWLRLGDALTNAGRSLEAADAYLVVQHRTRDAARATVARQRAARALLRAGHIDAGLEILEGLLGEAGIRLPQNPSQALRSLILRRIYLGLRGTRFVPRDEAQVPAAELHAIDLFFGIGTGLAYVDPIRAIEAGTRFFLAALRAGERTRIARALAMEIMSSAPSGGPGWPKTTAHIARARAMAKDIGDPYVHALILSNQASAEYFVGRFDEALGHFAEAETLYRERCVGVDWELAALNNFVIGALGYRGMIREITRRASQWRREIADRGNLFAATNMSVGFGVLPLLAADRADEAEGGVRSAVAAWSKEGYHLEHNYALIALTLIGLYRGDAQDADARWRAHEQAIARSHLTRVQMVRIALAFYRGQAAIAAFAKTRSAARKADALGHLRMLERERLPWVTPQALTLRGALFAADGDGSAAERCFALAAPLFAAAQMTLNAAACRARAGALCGDRAGRAAETEALSTIAGEGVARPEAFIAMYTGAVPLAV